MTKCLKCGGSAIVAGSLKSSGDGKLFGNTHFLPDNVGALTSLLGKGVQLYKQSYACLDCGSVWSETEAGDLRDYIRKHGKSS